MDTVAWAPRQLPRNRFVRFRTEFMLDRFVDLPRDGAYRILDFGCGKGHSLEVMLERFPNARLVGADFASGHLDDVEAHFRGHPQVGIVRMTGPASMPNLGDGFDVIQLNAVYEHLLPDERTLLMSDLWRRLNVNGYLIVTETPWRWFPVETHCTSFPLVNYLPDRLALMAFRHCGRYSRSAGMDYALRKGLRGATVAEIVASLAAPDGTVQRVPSAAADARDLLDAWWNGESRQTRQKALAYRSLALLRRATGLVVSPWVNVVFRKLEQA